MKMQRHAKGFLCVLGLTVMTVFSVVDANQVYGADANERVVISLEAEDAVLSGGAGQVNASDCSGGKYSGNMGGGNHGTATFTVTASEAGMRKLNVYYCTGQQRAFKVIANNKNEYTLDCPQTSDWGKPNTTALEIDIELRKGKNTIQFTGVNNEYAPNLDKIEFVSTVGEQDTIAKGLSWNIDANGVFTLSGVGELGDRAWLSRADEIKTAVISAAGVTDTSAMFYGCQNLASVDLSGFDMSSVTDMTAMFSGCKSLTELDLSMLKGESLRGAPFGLMFEGCTSLKSIKFGDLESDDVISLEGMFTGLTALESVDVSGFNAKNVKYFSRMFAECTSLKSVTFGQNFKTESAEELWQMFYNCQRLKAVDMSGFVMNQVDYEAIFDGCIRITKIVAPAKVSQFSKYTAMTLPASVENKWYYMADGNKTECTTFQLNQGFAIEYIREGQVPGDGGEAEPSVPNTPSQPTNPSQPNTPSQPVTPGVPTTSITPVTPVLSEKEQNIADLLGITPETAQEIAAMVEVYGISEANLKTTEEFVTTRKNDADIAGSSFAKIQARAEKQTNTSVTLTWNKVSDADGYLVYGNKCGKKNSYKLLANLKGAKKTSYTAKKLRKGTSYKYLVCAYKNISSTKVTMATSKTIHTVTNGGKYGVAKEVSVKNTQITLRVKKSYNLSAKEVKADKTIKSHRKLRYESSSPKIATVSKCGKITAKKKGKCDVYVYAQNGVYAKVKVTVK